MYGVCLEVVGRTGPNSDAKGSFLQVLSQTNLYNRERKIGGTSCELCLFQG
jgi:hypothetical protein